MNDQEEYGFGYKDDQQNKTQGETPVSPPTTGYYNEHGEYISTPTVNKGSGGYNYQNFDYQQNPHQQQQNAPNQNQPYRWDYNNFENYNQEPRRRKNKGLIAFLITLVGVMLVGVIAISVVGMFRGTDNAITDATASSMLEPESQPPDGDAGIAAGLPSVNPIPKDKTSIPAAGSLLTIPQVASKVTPSVVGILRYENTLYEATGLGSGFIMHVDEDGVAYIITNAHVVEYGTNFKVRLADGAEYNADLVGADSISDLAVLKMKADNPESLVVAELGDSTQLEVGEAVVAIGNPIGFELSGSVTQGIISAVDRKLQVGSEINYIQTDAAINPGNSGGALANQYGQVIGINTMKVQATGYEGIGFAIPISEALPIVTEIVEFGRVASRPVLGITGREISETESLRLGCPTGIMVHEVSENARFTPEVKSEDVLTHINGVRMTTLAELKDQLNQFKVGDSVDIKVYRMVDTVNSEEIDVVVELIASEE